MGYFLDSAGLGLDCMHAIKEAILSENPNFRYQKNKHYCLDETEAKLADMTGNKPLILLNGFAPSNVTCLNRGRH